MTKKQIQEYTYLEEYGYYTDDDDDTFHGPFTRTVTVKTSSLEKAIKEIDNKLKTKKTCVLEGESYSSCGPITITDSNGRVVHTY